MAVNIFYLKLVFDMHESVEHLAIHIINEIKVEVTCFVFNKFKLCKILCQRV